MVIEVRRLAAARAAALGVAIIWLAAACGGPPTSAQPASPATSAPAIPATSAPAATATAATTATAAADAASSLPPIEPRETRIAVEDDERLVRVYLPNPEPTDLVPLVIVLHAAGDSPSLAVRETRFDRLGIAEGFIVAFPPAHGRAWAAQVTPGLADSDTDERYLRGLIDRLVEQLPVDPKRVYVTGFSMGAVMAGRLACQAADRIAAAAVVSGTPWIGDCRPSRPVSILIVHGTGDTTFRHGPANAMAEAWRTRLACPGSPASEPIGDGATAATSIDCADGTAVEFVSVENGWHTWFKRPDATALAWRFFTEHARD